MTNRPLYEKPDSIIHDITIDYIKELYDKNKKEEIKGVQMTESSYKGEDFYSGNRRNLWYETTKEYLERDSLTEGFKMEYPHGIVIEQSLKRDYYRGENQIYAETIPSLNRALKSYKTEKERELYRMVADMRISEFSFLLQKFKHVKEWDYCDVLYETIAQHYGIQTGWLDITSDFGIALFFATCSFDNVNRQWKPLTKKQTDVDENHRYGMLFHTYSSEVNRRWCANQDKFFTISPKSVETDENGNSVKSEILESPTAGLPDNLIYPIGFQPFMRCHMQNGYAIYMRDNRPLQTDKGFEKWRFRHDESLSKWIFDKMEGGELVYPHEGLKEADYIIESIAHETKFSEEAFLYALNRNHLYRLIDAEECKEDLYNFIVEGKRIEIINKHPWKLSAGRRKKIDSLYSNFSLESYYGIKILWRDNPNRGYSIFEPWMLKEKENEPGTIDFEPRKISKYSGIYARNHKRIFYALKFGKMPDF